MYTEEILQQGIQILGIIDPLEIEAIRESNRENLEYLEERRIHKEQYEAWQKRHDVPRGLTKKEYTALLKETQKKIDELKEILRHEPERLISEMEFEKYIEKKKKINNILKFHKKLNSQDDTFSIEKAKSYPVDQLIEFNRAGFASCPDHTDKTPSMKLYRDRNKAHCFSCHADMDSIDIYMKINSVTLNEAVKRLIG